MGTVQRVIPLSNVHSVATLLHVDTVHLYNLLQSNITVLLMMFYHIATLDTFLIFCPRSLQILTHHSMTVTSCFWDHNYYMI